MAMRSATRSSLIMSTRVFTLDILRVTARRQPFRIEVWLAPKLNNASRNLVRMCLFFVGVLKKLGGHAFGIDSACHEVVSLVTQHADDLGRECFVQEFDNRIAVRRVSFGNRALFDVFASALAQRLNVGKKRFTGHRLGS